MGICLSVVAKAPIPGFCKTRLAATVGREAAADLHRDMLLDTLHRLRDTDATRLVVLAAPEHDGVSAVAAILPEPWEVVTQEGKNLGERLSHAVETLGRDGDGVVVVGSDSPLLPVDAIARSLSHLACHPAAILGPALDGGYYLIGLSAPDRNVFYGIPWSTPSVLADTRRQLRRRGYDTLELPPTLDIDVVEDLALLKTELDKNPGLAPRSAAWLSRMGWR